MKGKILLVIVFFQIVSVFSNDNIFDDIELEYKTSHIELNEATLGNLANRIFNEVVATQPIIDTCIYHVQNKTIKNNIYTDGEAMFKLIIDLYFENLKDLGLNTSTTSVIILMASSQITSFSYGATLGFIEAFVQ